MKKLKKCPFCGGEVKCRNISPWSTELWLVICYNCLLELGGFDTKKEAIAACGEGYSYVVIMKG